MDEQKQTEEAGAKGSSVAKQETEQAGLPVSPKKSEPAKPAQQTIPTEPPPKKEHWLIELFDNPEKVKNLTVMAVIVMIIIMCFLFAIKVILF